MDLVEILARELKKWPGEAAAIVQNEAGNLTKLDSLQVKFEWNQWDYTSGEMMRICGQRDGDFGRELASDHATAIVTRADWQAAKDKLEGKTVKKPNANKDGWVRHRGGKCPVEAGTMIDVRHRAGDVFTECKVGESCHCKDWSHSNDDSDIMAYRIHTPSEQPATVKESLPVEPVAPISGPLQWRDRITEIDAESKAENERHSAAMIALSTERADLVQKLASEGLAMIERKAEPVEDMSDPAKWREGDLLECVFRHEGAYTMGKLYSFIRLSEWGTARTLDDTGEENGVLPNQLKWHSRPTN